MMTKQEIIVAISKSNIPVKQKQEIIKRIKHTADPGKIVMIVIEFLQLGLDFLGKFPPP